jgi:hypothetical protein
MVRRAAAQRRHAGIQRLTIGFEDLRALARDQTGRVQQHGVFGLQAVALVVGVRAFAEQRRRLARGVGDAIFWQEAQYAVQSGPDRSDIARFGHRTGPP